jgi:hypothetical protein
MFERCGSHGWTIVHPVRKDDPFERAPEALPAMARSEHLGKIVQTVDEAPLKCLTRFPPRFVRTS